MTEQIPRLTAAQIVTLLQPREDGTPRVSFQTLLPHIDQLDDDGRKDLLQTLGAEGIYRQFRPLVSKKARTERAVPTQRPPQDSGEADRLSRQMALVLISDSPPHSPTSPSPPPQQPRTPQPSSKAQTAGSSPSKARSNASRVNALPSTPPSTRVGSTRVQSPTSSATVPLQSPAFPSSFPSSFAGSPSARGRSPAVSPAATPSRRKHRHPDSFKVHEAEWFAPVVIDLPSPDAYVVFHGHTVGVFLFYGQVGYPTVAAADAALKYARAHHLTADTLQSPDHLPAPPPSSALTALVAHPDVWLPISQRLSRYSRRKMQFFWNQPGRTPHTLLAPPLAPLSPARIGELLFRMTLNARQRDADKSWNYRQQNRQTVNEKARLRMQRKRDALRNAPVEIQLIQAQKARQYRRDYRQRAKTKAVQVGTLKRITAKSRSCVPLRRRRPSPRLPFDDQRSSALNPATPPTPYFASAVKESDYDAEDEDSDF
ncbi:hypothetical protein R3P38DRAFT_2776927 [Favolaschia claudopus]|uniref:Uncharacterized protein n=1 Tax=Favolaschia claudopus TaxID=2862362 RepID=A0AAW0BP44_9AGAR